MRNFLATLFLSQGVPMLQAGDEFARTQRGNNNAYCQDNEISWVDWQLAQRNHDLLRFVRLLAQLRRRHVEFRRETFLKGAASRAGVKDVTWLNVRGAEMTQGDWQDANLRTLGIWFGKRSDSGGTPVVAAERRRSAQQTFRPAGGAGRRTVDPSIRHGARRARAAAASGAVREYRLDASSAALLEC